ncbi:MAG: hypothetical protein N2322_02385, partial [Terrimicrobiaceae bacterium]|nr:hypothetical protein [Terrimicrobiaceae bacterium]
MPAASRSSPAPAQAILGAGAILLACTLEARAQAPPPAAPPAARDAADPAPPQTPAASPAAAAADPAILDELESIQLVPDDWNFQPVATDSPLPENPSAGLGRRAKEADYSFAGMTPPAFSQGDLAARAVEEMLRESAPPSFDPYPRAVRTPDYNDPLPAWILGTPMSLAAIAPFSAERRALGSLNAPNWLRANRSLRVGTARVRYAIEADAQGAFATNVLGTSDNPQNDFLFTLQPAFYAEMGTKNQVRFLYMPTLVRYQKFRQFDAFNQSFLFGSRFRAAKLQLGLDVSYVTQSGLFLSSAGQARQQSLIA